MKWLSPALIPEWRCEKVRDWLWTESRDFCNDQEVGKDILGPRLKRIWLPGTEGNRKTTSMGLVRRNRVQGWHWRWCQQP